MAKKGSGLVCGACRSKKVKCTKERPTCKRCTQTGTVCEYTCDPPDNRYPFVPPSDGKGVHPDNFNFFVPATNGGEGVDDIAESERLFQEQEKPATEHQPLTTGMLTSTMGSLADETTSDTRQRIAEEFTAAANWAEQDNNQRQVLFEF